MSSAIRQVLLSQSMLCYSEGDNLRKAAYMGKQVTRNIKRIYVLPVLREYILWLSKGNKRPVSYV